MNRIQKVWVAHLSSARAVHDALLAEGQIAPERMRMTAPVRKKRGAERADSPKRVLPLWYKEHRPQQVPTVGCGRDIRPGIKSAVRIDG